MKNGAKTVKIKNMEIGPNAPVSIQSMCTADTKNVSAVVSQIHKLEEAGCDIIRIAVPDEESACAVYDIKNQITIPLVADIHFDYRLALACIERGIDKIRINPGNIGTEDNIKKVALAAKEKGIPIRIGINGGSLEKDILARYGECSPEAMCESARRHIDMLTRYDFDDIVLSLKASSVKLTVAAYRMANEMFPYPLHVGITEAGTLSEGIVKSSVGIGALLLDGIGDTIRVSLTADPVHEVEAGHSILKAVGLLENYVEVISCPTCARCKIDLIPIAEKVNMAVKNIRKPIKVAVMGCVVNGPGEAREADVGIAGGDGCAVLFRKGEIVKKIREDEITTELLDLIKGI